MPSEKIRQFPGCDSGETFADYWEYCQDIGAFQSKREAYARFHMTPEQYFRNCGWVYVLANPFLIKGIYKVGRTTGRIERRMRQLYTTGLPGEFECLYTQWFADCITAERYTHSILEGRRVSDSREFFQADLKQIKHAIMEVSTLGEMHPDHMLSLAQNRHNHAISHEKVNGRLAVPEPAPVDFDLEELPF